MEAGLDVHKAVFITKQARTQTAAFLFEPSKLSLTLVQMCFYVQWKNFPSIYSPPLHSVPLILLRILGNARGGKTRCREKMASRPQGEMEGREV